MIFGAIGATSAAIGAQLGALGAPNVDFGSIWEVILEPFGDQRVTSWSLIGALDGVFWFSFCSIYFRQVFGSKMSLE